jgi:hypothetical protein
VDRDIFDQAVHMYIVYRLDWHDRLVRLDNAHSPVLTVGSFGEFKTQPAVLFSDLSVCRVVCVCGCACACAVVRVVCCAVLCLTRFVMASRCRC